MAWIAERSDRILEALAGVLAGELEQAAVAGGDAGGGEAEGLDKSL
jgi:hypothetical protein